MHTHKKEEKSDMLHDFVWFKKANCFKGKTDLG